jgi:hypothetical protein
MRAAAPVVLIVVFAWVTADTVVAMRQALDYRSTMRAVIVCIAGWLVVFGLTAAVAAISSQSLS